MPGLLDIFSDIKNWLPSFDTNNTSNMPTATPNVAPPVQNNDQGMFGFDKDTMGMLGMGLLGASGGGQNFLGPLMMMKMLGGNNNNANSDPNTMQAPQYDTSVHPLSYTPRVNGLNEKLQAALPGIMSDLQSEGWQPTIASGIRTPAEQAEKVRQGYSQTMNSKHLLGKAVDIVDKRYGWDGPAANKNYQFWKDLGDAARSRGLQWGGDWKSFKDVAHIQTSLANMQGLLGGGGSYYA
jgi:peptidoglycan L-alanyl-D-glutamate endopeptidase CwlK